MEWCTNTGNVFLLHHHFAVLLQPWTQTFNDTSFNFCFSKNTHFRGASELCPFPPCSKIWLYFHINLSNFIFYVEWKGDKKNRQESDILRLFFYVLIFFSTTYISWTDSIILSVFQYVFSGVKIVMWNS